jgi:hypothetical protein
MSLDWADAAAFGFDHRLARGLRRYCGGARFALDVFEPLLRALLLGDEAFEFGANVRHDGMVGPAAPRVELRG